MMFNQGNSICKCSRSIHQLLGFAVAGACVSGVIIFLLLPRLALLAAEPGSTRQESGQGYNVEIVVPEVRTNKRGQDPSHAAGSNEEECTTSCSLAKHAIAEFTPSMFHDALSEVAAEAVGQPSLGLDTLLFYNKRTLELLDEIGSGPLSQAHTRFLRRELARDHATVSIRMVDENGRIRASYGPAQVPLGQKQHLSPADTSGLFPMEFNGTVMRTGLYRLWSRY